jgi:hypothetical protein
MELKRIQESNSNNFNFILEIILPSYDSFDEISLNFDHIFKSDLIKITVLETKITSRIIELCSKNNVFLYERMTDDSPENYFLFYINKFVKHDNYLLFLYADEYFSFEELNRIFNAEFDLLFLNRFEFFYGENSNLNSKQLRGGRVSKLKSVIKTFVFKKSFHDFWLYNNVDNFTELCLEVSHLHKYDVFQDYGKSSKYVFEEIKLLSMQSNFKFVFVKRFLLRLISRIVNVKLLFKNRNIYAYLIFAQIIESSNAILFILENKFKKK